MLIVNGHVPVKIEAGRVAAEAQRQGGHHRRRVLRGVRRPRLHAGARGRAARTWRSTTTSSRSRTAIAAGADIVPEIQELRAHPRPLRVGDTARGAELRGGDRGAGGSGACLSRSHDRAAGAVTVRRSFAGRRRRTRRRTRRACRPAAARRVRRTSRTTGTRMTPARGVTMRTPRAASSLQAGRQQARARPRARRTACRRRSRACACEMAPAGPSRLTRPRRLTGL